MKIIQQHITRNQSYINNVNKADSRYTSFQQSGPKGAVLHSVGAAQPSAKVFANYFNNPNLEASVHAVLQPDGTVYQLAPWNYRMWHVGGSANNTHIGVEMTEPDCNYELDKFLQSFPFSYDYLRKLFKKELGVTPHKYLTDKRLQTAADMLSYGYTDSHNIAEISQQCGFREPLYFSRMFKKKYGVAPSYYLESQQKPRIDPDEDSVKIKLE